MSFTRGLEKTALKEKTMRHLVESGLHKRIGQNTGILDTISGHKKELMMGASSTAKSLSEAYGIHKSEMSNLLHNSMRHLQQNYPKRK